MRHTNTISPSSPSSPHPVPLLPPLFANKTHDNQINRKKQLYKYTKVSSKFSSQTEQSGNLCTLKYDLGKDFVENSKKKKKLKSSPLKGLGLSEQPTQKVPLAERLYLFSNFFLLLFKINYTKGVCRLNVSKRKTQHQQHFCIKLDFALITICYIIKINPQF